jgi:hypothetical protein
MGDLEKGIYNGRNYVRDELIAQLIGWQNNIGNDKDSEEYKAYQRVIDYLENNFGKFLS